MSKLYSTLFNLVALSVIVYTGVDIFYRTVRLQLREIHSQEIVLRQSPGEESRETRAWSDYSVITDRNLFGSVGGAQTSPKEEKTREDIEALEPTSLQVALLGTVTGNQGDTYAVIEERNRKQGLYREGDSVQNATVKRILRSKVILRVGDKDEILTMEDTTSSPGAPPSKPAPRRPRPRALETAPEEEPGEETDIVVERSDLQGALKNINRLMTQARVEPYFKGGKAEGFRVSRIQSGSLFSRLGMKNGDVIKAINGKPIKSPDDAVAFYKTLKSGSQLKLDIQRQGRTEVLNFTFR